MNPTTTSYIERIMGYLQQTAEARDVTLPSETESLFTSDVLDSFGLVEFVAFIESELDIQIPDDDLIAGKFETIAKLREYIRERMEG